MIGFWLIPKLCLTHHPNGHLSLAKPDQLTHEIYLVISENEVTKGKNLWTFQLRTNSTEAIPRKDLFFVEKRKTTGLICASMHWVASPHKLRQYRHINIGSMFVSPHGYHGSKFRKKHEIQLTCFTEATANGCRDIKSVAIKNGQERNGNVYTAVCMSVFGVNGTRKSFSSYIQWDVFTKTSVKKSDQLKWQLQTKASPEQHSWYWNEHSSSSLPCTIEMVSKLNDLSQTIQWIIRGQNLYYMVMVVSDRQ